jgi:6-phosphogluconolactonase
VQYACPDPTGRYLYVVSSNGAPGIAGTLHYLSAFCIEWPTGRLHANGEVVRLRHRPVHVTTDRASAHVLIAYISPSMVTVHRIAPDGSIAGEVAQPPDLDAGVFAHQVYVMPSNTTAVVVARGNDAHRTAPEEPGALKVFSYTDGVLANAATIAPGGGHGFGPRNIALHPSQRWLYVSLERQNRLDMFRVEDESIHPARICSRETLADPGDVWPVQMAGAVHIHPRGHVLYLANRAFGTTDSGGSSVFSGGENSIAVFDIDGDPGEPRVIQHADTHGIYPRTFSIDPTGRMLVAANSTPLLVNDGNTVTMTAANLAVFSIAADGSLEYIRRYDIEDTSQKVFWSGMVTPGAGIAD